MQAIIIRILTLFLTFIVGLSVVTGLRALFHSNSTISVKKSEAIILTLPAENRLKETYWSSGRGMYGCILATGYETSDGETLSYSSIPYASATDANKDLRRGLRNALQIIERAPKLDWNKRKVGERVVAMFPHNAKGKQRFGVLWTDKSTLRIVAASTLELALGYEQKEARWDR